MSYATVQDLIDRFGATELMQLTDRVNRPATTIDSVVAGKALDDAEDFVNGYLAKVHALPLSTTPGILTRMTADIARYFLHGKAADKDGPVARAYDQALAWLKDVARGLVALEAEGVAPAQSGGGTVQANPSTRVFTRDSLRGA